VQDRLGTRARAALNLVLEALCLGFALIVLWQLWRLEVGSWVRADQSDTLLAMPLWIPRAAMVFGMGALALVLVRDMARVGRRCLAPRD
jgi:TRAP-type C4-dicarboxylate transport system permease small subunit